MSHQICEQEIVFYTTPEGKEPYVTWIEGLKDLRGAQKIEARLARLRAGNLGDIKPVGEGK
jgi:putative addiction module killer protein